MERERPRGWVEIRFKREALHELKIVNGLHGIEDAFELPVCLLDMWAYAAGHVSGADGWPDGWLQSTIRLSTYTQYRSILDKHIFPVLGHVQVQKLTPQQVQSFYARKEKEGLAPATIRTMHAVLHNALSHAVSINLVGRNVCDVVKRPCLVRHERHSLTVEQAQKLLRYVQGRNLEGLITVALATGMRRGELLGLRWQDINFDTRSLQVQRTISRQRKRGIVESEPKTSRGGETSFCLPLLSMCSSSIVHVS